MLSNLNSGHISFICHKYLYETCNATWKLSSGHAHTTIYHPRLHTDALMCLSAMANIKKKNFSLNAWNHTKILKIWSLRQGSNVLLDQAHAHAHKRTHTHTHTYIYKVNYPVARQNSTVYDAVGQCPGLIKIKISCWSVSKWVAKRHMGVGWELCATLDHLLSCGRPRRRLRWPPHN